MSNTQPTVTTRGVFGPLPAELLLNILDQLVQTRDGHRPIAYPQYDGVTKTLRSLTLVSRNVYPMAITYLYSNCVWLGSPFTFSRFCTALELNRQRHTLASDKTIQQNRGFVEIDPSRHITSAYISLLEDQKLLRNSWCSSVRLPSIVDLCHTIGSTLKRLYLNTSPVDTLFNPMESAGWDCIDHHMFSRMLQLEELMISHDVIDCFQHLPPNLKRLAVVGNPQSHVEPTVYLFSSSLETLALPRPYRLTASDIDTFFTCYHGKSLDIILFETNYNHETPPGTREWKSDDAVCIWEADVPISFYGDDDPSELCDEWMWDRGIAGTLWSQTQRRMASWAEI